MHTVVGIERRRGVGCGHNATLLTLPACLPCLRVKRGGTELVLLLLLVLVLYD